MATSPAAGAGSGKPCPLCGRPAQARFAPFCSHRCRLRDLAHWIGGDEPYVIPGRPLLAGEGEAPPPQDEAGGSRRHRDGER